MHKNTQSLLCIMRDILFSGTLFAWFLLPLFFPEMFPFVPLHFAENLQAVAQETTGLAWLFYALVLTIPLNAIWKLLVWIIAPLRKHFSHSDSSLGIGLDLFSTAVLLIFQIIHAILFTPDISHLFQWHWLVLGLTVSAVVFNGWALIRIIQLPGKSSHAYQEYKVYKDRPTQEDASGAIQSPFWGIQRRLVLSFIAIILVIIVVLCSALLNDFSRTIKDAVVQNGMALADRTASIIKANIADDIVIDEYMDIESKKNELTKFPFKSMTYYRLVPQSNVYIIASSTIQGMEGTQADLQINNTDGISVLDNDQQEFIRFFAPLQLSGKLIGAVAVEYQKSVIFGPYFRTEVKVVIFATVFIYISIFLTYLFGRNIVIPILFLRMSVNAISGNLSQMIRGGRKISGDQLQYKDRVQTKDEIKGLSTEIGNMAGVIRGIIPYISASTLKNADKNGPSTERKDMAFLFTDIRGFTTLCENLDPEKVVSLLNTYLELQTAIILSNKGDIDKFVGDEIMASFEGPDKEVNACKAAIAIREAMAVAEKSATREARDVVTIGIGINAGPVIFGSVGARDRMDFTSIGDTVNLAARLEGANKTYGTKSLLTETVYSQVADKFLCREIDLLTVKGKNKPVRIYEIVIEKAVANPDKLEFKEKFETALQLYREMNWPAAQKAFQLVAKNWDDETSRVFMRRMELFKNDPPPANWDGVFALSVK